MRLKGLDFLRGIAVIMVLFRHSDMTNILFEVGWLGVDLFFVLSGFLVSGLLFNEYKKSGELRIKRFLLRRGFKIFPPFYIFLIVTFIVEISTGTLSNLSQYLGELFYLQSYAPKIWIHTWSLAVEEHFYFMLAAILFLVVKYKKLENKKNVIIFLVIALIISFSLRMLVSYPNRFHNYSFIKTHLRLDGIIIGVLISYLYHFTNFYQHFLKNRLIYLFSAIILVLPAFFYKGASFFMNTYGLTSVNLGFAIFVLLSLESYNNNKYIDLPFSFIRLVGVHSYSIYLWHLMVHKVVKNLVNNVVKNLVSNVDLLTILYLILSIFVGILLSIIIEKQVLKLRERYVP